MIRTFEIAFSVFANPALCMTSHAETKRFFADIQPDAVAGGYTNTHGKMSFGINPKMFSLLTDQPSFWKFLTGGHTNRVIFADSYIKP